MDVLERGMPVCARLLLLRFFATEAAAEAAMRGAFEKAGRGGKSSEAKERVVVVVVVFVFVVVVFVFVVVAAASAA